MSAPRSPRATCLADELFITTKLTNSEHGYDTTLAAFDGSMKKLGLDVLDLFLIHWPLPMFDQYVETWRAFERLLADGRVRSIGVSNFEIPHLQRLLAETDVTPAVNQVELHPEFPQEELRAFHDEHGILTESWGPLGQGKGLLENPDIVEVARRKGRTPAQVVLRWHVQLGCVVIPKSVHPDRMRENIELFDFELDDARHGRDLQGSDRPASRRRPERVRDALAVHMLEVAPLSSSSKKAKKQPVGTRCPRPC